MKTVELFRDFDYRPHPRRSVCFHAGVTYSHVLETAAREIEQAGAGRIVSNLPDAVGEIVDASHTWRRRQPSERP